MTILRHERLKRQKTLVAPVTGQGVGLHSGRATNITLRPAEANHGIVFKRVDVDGRDQLVPARYDRVVDTQLCTVIMNDDGVRVSTIEHLMAALAGCEVDNALVEIDGPEVPIMDGSSEPFITLIDQVGVIEQEAARKAIRVREQVSVGDESRGLTITPSDSYFIDFEIDFDSKAVNKSRRSVEMVNGTFRHQLCRARTFGFAQDVEKLRTMGLALGGSLSNAIVVDGDRILNKEGLRYDDEFVRHKILDCVGDLYLAGAPIIGHVTATKSGHATNNEILRELFANPEAYELVDLVETAVDMPMAATA